MYELIKYNNFVISKSMLPNSKNYNKILLDKNLVAEKMDHVVLQKFKTIKKKIFLKGLGYKIVQENKFLIFKLNFSHMTKISIPDFIKKIKITKSYMIVESFDNILLGNFLEKIYNLRPKNCYKGKGFFLVTKVVPLKAVKKK